LLEQCKLMQKYYSCGVGILPALALWQASRLPYKRMYEPNGDTPDRILFKSESQQLHPPGNHDPNCAIFQGFFLLNTETLSGCRRD